MHCFLELRAVSFSELLVFPGGQVDSEEFVTAELDVIVIVGPVAFVGESEVVGPKALVTISPGLIHYHNLDTSSSIYSEVLDIS